METLYLEVAEEVEAKNEISASLESVIALVVLKYIKATWVKLVFTSSFRTILPFHIKKQSLADFDVQFISKNNLSQQVSNCVLPVVAKNNNFYIAGLCAVLRFIIKQTNILHPQELLEKLLGFRQGCLMACSEVSVWTRFCEVDFPKTTKALYSKSNLEQRSLPVDLLRFNHHLGQSVRIHNINKHRQKAAKNDKNVNSKLNSVNRANALLDIHDHAMVPKEESKFAVDSKKKVFDEIFFEKMSIGDSAPKINEKLSSELEEKLPNLDHLYAEGIERTLADIILFPCFHYILLKLKYYESTLLQHIPTVMKWYKRMQEDPTLVSALQEIISIDSSNEISSSIKESLQVPQIKPESLYIRDPNRIRTVSKIKYHQPVIEETIKYLTERHISAKFQIHPCQSVVLDWLTFPEAVHPLYGELPINRCQRKCQQLENLISVILRIVKEGDVIVDFCSGGGHLGIVLSFLLPNCQIILIDNKEESLYRAMHRIQHLGLTNILIYQTNMDYFKGKFTIGTSLHACGVATDLVLKQCLEIQAAIIACPCCYGAIKDVQEISYPRSKQFRNSRISYKNYCLLGHAADQTHINDPKAEQGKLCMGIIDTDRLSYLQEHEYFTYLCSLFPLTCTPKNNLLIALPPNRGKFDIL